MGRRLAIVSVRLRFMHTKFLQLSAYNGVVLRCSH